ncbi:MAG: hypothetical protein Q8941_13155 [Bacteroidota bacterium]|nr:hypothetical protein [Bacteroidota bacterium]
MKLNRHNYEEYFILYLDNELDSESRREVEEFAQANPDLKAELDILLQSKLTPDTDIVFDNKESLLARNSSSLNLTNYEGWLLSYIDNELTGEERKDVERLAADHPVVRAELNLLLQAKLQPEAIVFPHKESLYRREEKTRVIAIRWWRIAAAVILLLGISATTIILINKKPGNSQNGDNMATTITNKTKEVNSTKDTTTKPLENVIPPVKDNIASIQPGKNESPVKETSKNIVRKEDNKNNGKEKIPEQQPVPNDPLIARVEPLVKQPSNNLPDPGQNPHVNTEKGNSTIAQAGKDPEEALTNSTKKNESNDVTPAGTDSLNNENKVPVNPDDGPIYASNKNSNKGIRGFLRKVTRTFEKRTNIKATDDDDRLLIAGLALKVN